MTNTDGVHINHCCVLHGCKYNDWDCPVTTEIAKQKYPCEWCREDAEIPPAPPPKRIIKPDVSKEFLKGMLWAFLIIILIHIGIAYVLYFY